MADATSLEWQILDDQGVPNRSQMFVGYDGATETIDALIGAWTSYGGMIDACIDGQIIGGQILIPLIPNSSWKTAPVNGNNCNQVMNINFDNDFNSYATPLLLPSYKESTLTGKRPNVGGTPLSTLIAAILGGYLTEVFPNSRDLHDLNALRNAFLTVRKLKANKRATEVFG
jgi:hypothetical protein